MEQSYEPVWEIMINSGVYDDLKGTIDIHCHPNPDFCKRLLDCNRQGGWNAGSYDEKPFFIHPRARISR